MSSCENGVPGWSPRHVRGIDELLDPVTSPGDGSRFAPEEPLGGIDRCLHLPGKADSAYSSFSGGSNLPEYPVPLCYSDHDSLPLEHLPYMDTGYVRGIYNPSAIKEGLGQMYGNEGSGKSSHYQLEITGHSRLHESISNHGVLHQTASSLGRSTLPCPAQVESYQANTGVHQSPGICTGCSIPADVRIQERSKGPLFDTSTKCYNDYWLSRCQGETLVTEIDAEYLAKPHTVKENSSSISVTPSAFCPETLMPGSAQKVLQAQNATHTFKVPETMNSDSSPLLQTSHSAVNDTQKNKQGFYACSVHKPPTAGGGLPSTVAVSSQPEGQLRQPQQLLGIHACSEPEYVSTAHLNYVDSPLPTKPGLGRINSHEEKKRFICSEGGKGRDSWQPVLKQQTTMQKPHSCSLDFVETPHATIYEPTKTGSYYSRDAEDTLSQPFNRFGKSEENDHYSSPELLLNFRQGEMLETVGFPKQPFSKKADCHPQEDSVSEKINRKTTPLLYYLSGGKNPSVMSHKAHSALEPEASSVKSSRSPCPGAAQPVEVLGGSHPCVDNRACADDGLILESCMSSSLDEKFKNDYREKLQVAQRKVLRETSFKRKDLQMSLPIRLKQKTSSRPSIHHFRSWSLSGTNEEPKPVPPFKPLGQLRKDEESQRLPAVRIGGRKRATAEQKKISYSEPEKLNQLEDQRDPNEAWKKKNARSHSDEISEKDTRLLRIKALESRGKALTKAELKQIQHKALREYMERKSGQRTAPANNNNAQQQQQQQQQQQNPPLQSWPSNPKRFSEDGSCSPSGKLQSTDGLFQTLGPPSFPSAGTSIDGSSNSASTKCLRHSASSATTKGHGGSRSTSSPVQDFSIPTASLALSAEDHGHYQIHPNSLSKVNLEAVPKDALVAAHQAGSLETTRWSSLKPSTDQLHPMKGRHVFSRTETGQKSQGANHQHIWDNRQSSSEDAASQAFEQPHRTTRNNDKFSSASDRPSLSPVPLLPGRRSLCTNEQGESHDSSAVFSLTEMEEDVFKDSPASVSDMDPNVPHFPRQSMCLTVVRETPPHASAAPVLQIYMKGQQMKEEQNMSDPHLGDNQGDENLVRNSHCPERTCEYLAFCFQKESSANSQPKKEMSETSQVSSASHVEHLEGKYRTHHSEDGTYHCTALSDSQGCKKTGSPLAHLKSDHDCNVPAKAADSSIAQSKSPEDQICEDLAAVTIAKDKPLVDILTPHPLRKTTLEFMEGLFPVHLSVPGRSYRRKEGFQSVQENNQRSSDQATDPPHRTSYYLGQGAEDATFHIHQTMGKNKDDDPDPDDPENIASKKRELISSIQSKLQALWDERESILSEVKAHAEHGTELESLVQGLCKPNEYERYMMFIGDLEKVVSLLLCLSSRLARVQNAMEKIDENTDAEEKHSLKERHRLLSRQREDAKDLKENLDRRERVVSGILSKYMTENQLQDYRHFVQEKTSLLIEQKDLDDQIKFLEEQLERLQMTIAP